VGGQVPAAVVDLAHEIPVDRVGGERRGLGAEEPLGVGAVERVAALVELPAVLLLGGHVAPVLVDERAHDDLVDRPIGDGPLHGPRHATARLDRDLEREPDERRVPDAEDLHREAAWERLLADGQGLQVAGPDDPLGPVRALPSDAAGVAGCERRDAVHDRRQVLGGAGHERSAHRRAIGQLDVADAAVAGAVEVDLPEAGIEGQLVGQRLAQPVVELGGGDADPLTDASRLAVAGLARAQRRGDVGVGALRRAHDRPVPVAVLDAMRELGHEVAPHVGVVLVGVLGDAGAVDGEDDGGGERLGPAVGRDAVGTDQVEVGVDRHPLPLRVQALVGDRAVLHVGVVGAVAGEAPHLGAADRDLGGHPGVVGLDHRGGDLVDEEVGVGRVEAAAVGRVAVVEVGAEELARPGVGVGRPHPDAGERDVGALAHGLRDEVLQHGGPGEQVELHERQRRAPGAQVGDPGAQPGAEPVAVVGVGRVPGLRHARGRGDVGLGRAGEHAVDLGQLGHRAGGHPEPAAARGPVDERSERGGAEVVGVDRHGRRPYRRAGRHLTSGPAARSLAWPRRPSRGHPPRRRPRPPP
jgi:hypothetical protein